MQVFSEITLFTIKCKEGSFLFFSVLVPVYNTSMYLSGCMESILSQTFTDYEVVLLDDGSKDNSGVICDEYAKKDKRVRVVHKENEGLMMTRRRGFKEAKGDFFICVDSDDKFFDNQALERIHLVITETNCDMVLYNYVYGEGGGRAERIREIFDYSTGHVFEGKHKRELYDKLLTTNYMNNMWIKCPARSVVDIDTDYSVWKEEICRAEDLFQSFPMLNNAKRIAYVKEPLYYYRWAEGSISNNYKIKYYDSYKRIYARADAYIQLWEISSEIKEHTIRNRINGVTNVICCCYFSSKRQKTINKWIAFLDRLSNDPFYIHIMDECDKKKVNPYYKLLHSLIIKKKKNSTIFLIEITSFLSSKKKNKTQ